MFANLRWPFAHTIDTGQHGFSGNKSSRSERNSAPYSAAALDGSRFVASSIVVCGTVEFIVLVAACQTKIGSLSLPKCLRCASPGHLCGHMAMMHITTSHSKLQHAGTNGIMIHNPARRCNYRFAKMPTRRRSQRQSHSRVLIERTRSPLQSLSNCLDRMIRRLTFNHRLQHRNAAQHATDKSQDDTGLPTIDSHNQNRRPFTGCQMPADVAETGDINRA